MWRARWLFGICICLKKCKEKKEGNERNFRKFDCENEHIYEDLRKKIQWKWIIYFSESINLVKTNTRFIFACVRVWIDWKNFKCIRTQISLTCIRFIDLFLFSKKKTRKVLNFGSKWVQSKYYIDTYIIIIYFSFVSHLNNNNNKQSIAITS